MQRCIEGTRAAPRDGMEIMIDCYMSRDLEFSACLPERVRNCDVKCLKDPLPNGWAETRDAELRRLVNPMQMAIGNMEYGYKAYHSILTNRACDIIQPELHWCGGLTAVRRIAAMARAFDVPVIPMAPGPTTTISSCLT